MIFLFGFGERTHVDKGPLPQEHCPACGENHFRVLSKVKFWFSLFFIPIIPYRTQWVSRCTYCSSEAILPPDKVNTATEVARIHQLAIDEDWDDERFQRELKESQP